MSIGDLGPLLVPMLLRQGKRRSGDDDAGSCETSEVLPASFTAYLATLVGQRVKIYLRPQDFIEWVHSSVVIARVAAVDGDFLILEDIVIDGVPIVDPRRMVLHISTIDAVERITERQRLLETLLDLC